MPHAVPVPQADTESWRESTPFGRLTLTASSTHLIHVAWPGRGGDDAHAPNSRGRPEHPVLREAVEQLRAFVAGRSRGFSVPVSFAGVTGAFRRRVLETLHAELPFGHTITYGELALLAGRPQAARAVGSAMSHNPLPIFVPCHRVLASAGLGGFGPGLEVKRKLLRHEGVEC